MEDYKPVSLSEAHDIVRRAKSVLNIAEALTQVDEDNQEPLLWAMGVAIFDMGNKVDAHIPCEHKDE